jgi:PmbA protein
VLSDFCEYAVERAKRKGAQAASAKIKLNRKYKVQVRDGKKEEVTSSVSRALTIRLFVDGRYSAHSTSVLSRPALGQFIDNAVELTRILMPDPYRSLADAELYENRSTKDLQLYDQKIGSVNMAMRNDRATALYEAAKAATGDKLISASGGVSDRETTLFFRTSNGFADNERYSVFWQWATVNAKDPSGRRPVEWSEDGARRYDLLATPKSVAEDAARRTLAIIGAQTIASVRLPLIIENRALGRVLGGLLSPLRGRSLQQKRSCFEDALGKAIGSRLLNITDTPLLPGGWSSHRFDGEGITARNRPLFVDGTLKNFFIDTYYAKKMKRTPTTGYRSNLVFGTGDRNLDEICKDAQKAILVTSFLGGNSNSTTGDFSHGISGFLIEGGKRSRPIASMNIAGNHKTFWKKLLQVGNDPYRFSSVRSPSMLIGDVLVAGK